MNNERKLVIGGLIVLANILGFTGQFDKMTIGIVLVCVAAYLIIEWRKPLPKVTFEVFPAIAPRPSMAAPPPAVEVDTSTAFLDAF